MGMQKSGFIPLRTWATWLLILFLLAACQQPAIQTSTPSNTPAMPTAVITTATDAPTPTSTSIPSAAIVNGESIPLGYYQNEVLRYREGLPAGEAEPSEEEVRQAVLDYLVDQQLLSQAAREAGFSASATDVQTRVDELVAKLGSGGALTNWMETNHYDDAEFRLALGLGAEAAWQRDKIIAEVPEAVEQVRARQIFAKTAEGAQRALTSLNSGTAFDDLAWEYSPETGGELGWFPRGYLLFPQIEEAAFSLAVGEHSEIIQTEIGYHIILVIAHEDAHDLTTDARLSLQTKALSAWLENRRAQSQLEITLP